MLLILFTSQMLRKVFELRLAGWLACRVLSHQGCSKQTSKADLELIFTVCYAGLDSAAPIKDAVMAHLGGTSCIKINNLEPLIFFFPKSEMFLASWCPVSPF